MPRSVSELAIIDHLLCVATVRLFQAVGVDVAEIEDGNLPAAGPLLASTVGFSAPGVRGAVTLVIGRPTIAALYPEVALGTVEALRDAVGELSNLLVGELKRQLRAVGVDVELGLPVTFAGDGLRLCPAAAESRGQAFATRHGVVRVRLDGQLADVAFTAEGERDPAAAAGDTLFF